MLLRTSVFKQVGGFDPRYFMYFEDADLTREVQRFGKVIFNPEVSVYHAWGAEDTRSLKLLWIHVLSMCRYIYKWHGKD